MRVDWAIILLIATSGCQQSASLLDGGYVPVDSSAVARDGSCTGSPLQRFNVDLGRRDTLDLLLMVDNSNSMAEEQTSLSIEFEWLVQTLASGDLDGDGDPNDRGDFSGFRDIHIAVISSDMGTGGFVVPTCARSDFGDDGLLRTQGSGGPDCSATYPPFLSYRADTGAAPATAADQLRCVANMGTGGCGFEQPLEAMLKALSPSAPTSWTSSDYAPPSFFRGTLGHGDGANAGFVREGSVLAIVPFTDEEDCSSADPSLFDPASAVYGSTDLNLRCFAYADSAVHPIDRYVEGFRQLRRNTSRIVFAPIAGIPLDLAPTGGEPVEWGALISDDGSVRDDRMEERIDPSRTNSLVASCDVSGRGTAYPPVRLARVAERLETQGAHVTMQSICQVNLRSSLAEIMRTIGRAGSATCLPSALPTNAAGDTVCELLGLALPGEDCASLGAEDARDASGGQLFEDGRGLCRWPRLPPESRTPGSPAPAGAGWYYDTFTSQGASSCQRSLSTPWQRIGVTGVTFPSGSRLRLMCPEELCI